MVHPSRSDVVETARAAAAWLLADGHEVRLLEPDAAITGLTDHSSPRSELTDGLDLALSLGGDGTMLRTVDLVADADVPVLGVNLGHLGYLTEVEPNALTDALKRFVEGDYVIEERMRLAAEVLARADPDLCGVHPALNEVVLGKTPTGQIVRVHVSVDGDPFITYRADGIILATPTGSTAYAWSAGGPIIAPDHAAMLLTPVAPHMLFDRPLLLSPTTHIRLEVVADRPATLSVDGRNLGLLREGDALECTASSSPARLVSFGPRSFLELVKAKFGLADAP